MATYGFAIDLRKCIGCHACTIACKAEHQSPIDVNRCWVKTVEQGEDIEVDTEAAHRAYKEWMHRTRPAPRPGGLRRPLWFDRPVRPVAVAYQLHGPGVRTDRA